MKVKNILLLALYVTVISSCQNVSSVSSNIQSEPSNDVISNSQESSSEVSSSVESSSEVSIISSSSQSSETISSNDSSKVNSSSNSISQIHDNYTGSYYNRISDSLSGSSLQSELSKLITSGHNQRGYDALWNAYKTTDIKPGTTNVIWDIYSNYNYVVGKDQGGNYSHEGDCYNREHSIPKSWFGDKNPAYCDVHHIYPTDGKVNGMRSNYPYGEVSSHTYKSENGSKLGSSKIPGVGTVFEPIDEYKGDLARTYFYFATRYPGWATSGAGSKVFTNSYPYLSKYAIDLFTKWSQMDPVSQKEITRNEAAYKFQGNRNPFIDKPSYIAKIFGTYGGSVPTPNPNPITTSSDISSSYQIVKPVVGETYKLGFKQENNGETYWINGETKENTPWYLSTSTSFSEGCDVTVEETTNGYYLALTVLGSKKYLNMKKNGDHLNASIDSSALTVYTYDDTYKTFTGFIDDVKCFFGTFGTYTTLSCSKYSSISTSYPAHFYK